MPPISLDEIIHYRPSTEKRQFQAPQSIGFNPHSYPNISSEVPLPSHSFQPNQVLPPGFPLSTHAHGPNLIFRSLVETGPPLPLSESAEEVAFDLSGEMGLDFPDVTLEENIGVPVSLSVPGDQCDNWSRNDEWRKGTYMSPLQDPGKSDSVKEPSVSSLVSLGDEHFIVTEANDIGKKILPSRSADSAKVDRILQNSSAAESTTAKEYLNIKSTEHALSPTDEENHDPPAGVLSGDVSSSTGDVEVGPDVLRLKSPVCTNSPVIPPDEHDVHLIAECCESIQAEANEAVFTGAENELSHKAVEIPPASRESNRIGTPGRRPISMSPTSQRGEGQSKCKRIDTDAKLPSVSKLQSVVITNSRSRERDMRIFAPSAPPGRPKRKRGPSASSHDDSCSDGSSDTDDADYVSESSMLSSRSKRARPAAVRSSPAHLRHNKNTRRNLPSRCSVSRSSKNESDLQVPRDRRPMSSLSDMETIPIRGFLTREILLSKVMYSITFEERKENICLQEPVGTTPDCEREAQTSKLPQQKKSQVGKSIRPARVLTKDDKLLIELKEERGLSWNRIAEYFPERSKGSLQVRYCTRLKGRHIGSSESIYKSKDKSSPRGISWEAFRPNCGSRVSDSKGKDVKGFATQRYGSPRHRQPVDRYSPV